MTDAEPQAPPQWTPELVDEMVRVSAESIVQSLAEVPIGIILRIGEVLVAGSLRQLVELGYETDALAELEGLVERAALMHREIAQAGADGTQEQAATA